jgi:hypothetical protein
VSTTAAVLAQWDQWLSDATDRLMDLDGRTAGSDDKVRMDVAAAFVCRKVIAQRVDEMRAAGNDANRIAQQPVVDDQGVEVGADLAGAAALLTAVLDRVAGTIDADESVAMQLAHDSVAASTDLASAERLSTDLGQFVQRVAELRSRLDAAGRQPDALRQAAAAAAALRAELEAMGAERDDMFRRWAAVPTTLERYRDRQAEVQDLVERCREKVLPLPSLAVPSVDALSPPATVDELRAQPWPAARASMRTMLDRLDRLDDAYDEIERRFAAVLSRRDELRGLLHAFRDKAGGSSLAEHADLESAFKLAERELWSAPCDVERAEGLVSDYTAAVNRMIDAAGSAADRRGAP